jgi:hypothetical protein
MPPADVEQQQPACDDQNAADLQRWTVISANRMRSTTAAPRP